MADTVQKFKYNGPDAPEVRRRGEETGDSHDLLYNESTISTIQIMKKGQGNKMHAHRDQDGYWFVLSGKARFHGVNEIYADVGPMEGIFVPHHTRYWFESIDDVPLQILRVSRLLPQD